MITEDHVGPITLGSFDLAGCGDIRHHDGGLQAEELTGQCHRLGMVPAGMGDHPSLPLLVRQL
jgi:hypothetical protein